MKIAYLATVPAAAKSFLRGQLRHFSELGHDVRLFARGEPLLAEVAEAEGITAEAVPFERELTPLADLRALWLAWRALRRFRPDLTNVGMPKAGIVGGLAAALARVPARVYVMHGLRLETARGLEALILSITERLACLCAHRVLCVSESLRQKAIGLRLASPEKLQVLGLGTANGVNWIRFSTPPSSEMRHTLSRQLGLTSRTKVIGFVGRFNADKGLSELVEAFETIEARHSDARLLLIGHFEEKDPVAADARARIEAGGTIIWIPFVPDPAPYYHLMDMLVLPTRREGMGMVCLEAAAAGIPVVSTWATGARDAVVDGVTGRLVPVGDVAALATAICELLDRPERAEALGSAGRERVRTEFQPEQMWTSLEAVYDELLRRAGRGALRPGSPDKPDLQAHG